MITAITLQFQTNKKFENKSLLTNRIYGDRDTEDLQELLRTDIIWLQKFHALVSALNKNLESCDVQSLCIVHMGQLASETNVTKKKRRYFIAGLTIHEEDI